MRSIWFAVPMLALVIACGDAASQPKSGSSAPAPASTSAASAATPAAAATSSSAPPKVATGGGTATNDACTLITIAEVGQVMGATGVKAEPLAGDPAYCTYRDGAGAALAATTLMRKDAATGYQLWAGSARPVSGLGERAQWEPSTATLMVMKGGSVLAITAGDGRMDETKRQDLAKQLGALGAARQ